MTTEITPPPCPLPDCGGGEHHYHDIDIYGGGEQGHDCTSEEWRGYHCFGPHVKDQPGTQWQPIELDQIRAGMRIRATITYRYCVINRTGVAHHKIRDGWYTEDICMLTGWHDPTTYEVDSATIPDPDEELIEIVAELLHAGDPGSLDMWGELTGRERQNYRDQAREVVAAVRAHDEAVQA